MAAGVKAADTSPREAQNSLEARRTRNNMAKNRRTTTIEPSRYETSATVAAPVEDRKCCSDILCLVFFGFYCVGLAYFTYVAWQDSPLSKPLDAILRPHDRWNHRCVDGQVLWNGYCLDRPQKEVVLRIPGELARVPEIVEEKKSPDSSKGGANVAPAVPPAGPSLMSLGIELPSTLASVFGKAGKIKGIRADSVAATAMGKFVGNLEGFFPESSSGGEVSMHAVSLDGSVGERYAKLRKGDRILAIDDVALDKLPWMGVTGGARLPRQLLQKGEIKLTVLEGDRD